MADAEERKQRSAALEEKRRRLEELKKRRTKRGEDTAKVKASLNSNLDEYIDGLLAQPPAAGAPSSSAAGQQPAAAVVSAAGSKDDADNKSADGASASPGKAVGDDNKSTQSNASNVIAEPAPPPPPKVVETFTVATQTEDEDFPEPPEDDEDDEEDDGKPKEKLSKDDDDGFEGGRSNVIPPDDREEDEKDPKLLSAEEVAKEVSSTPFSTFINTASKKVERVLGTPLLGDLLVDSYAGDDDDVGAAGSQHRDRTKGGGDESRFVSSRQAFECPVWTGGRDVTGVDWSPLHRELFLSTYHLRSSASSSSSMPSSADAAVSVVSPKDTSSSSLTPRTGELQSDGLLLVWNLTMPARPEHVFTCGSPVTAGMFHPTEAPVVMGGCHSGQMVVWDVRAGRLPVQKSALSSSVPPASSSSSSAAAASKRGHVHPVDGMRIIEGGLGLVSSSADGRVNFWSLSNLREPVESIQVSDSVSCFCVMPETEALLFGDENGNLFSAMSSQATTADLSTPTKAAPAGKGGGGSGGAAGGGGGASGRATRRTIRKLDATDESGENFGHYGMVTSLSAKTLKRNSASRAAGLTRGFLRGSGGLVLSSGVDWTVKLWAPAYGDAPVLSTVSHSYDYMSDAQWCPNHPSLFATASCSGTVGLWNLATSLEEPITGNDGLVLAASDGGGGGQEQQQQQRGLNRLSWSGDGRRLAVASGDTVHLLTLTEDTVRPKADDDSKMMSQLASRGLIGAAAGGGSTAAAAAAPSDSRQ